MEDNKNKSLEEMIAETMKNKHEHVSSDADEPKAADSKINADHLKFKYYDGDNDEEQHHRHHEDKSSKKKKKALIVACSVFGIILTFFIVIGVVFFHYISMLNIKNTEDEILDSIDIEYTNDSNSPQSEIDSLEKQMKANFDKDGLMHSDNVMNILLLGTDSRENNARGRSDSMILVSINKVTKEIIMTSFLRDMYVSIPGKENSKLTHAYSYGGADLAVDTVEQNFKIKIDNYVQVNFYSFVSVVDAVGGVDIDVTADEVKYINSYLGEINKLEGDSTDKYRLASSGLQHLNGRQALAYSRIRYIGTDFARTERQRTVLTKVIQKASDLSIGELNDFVEDLFPLITTNLSKTTIASLILKSPTYFEYDLPQYRIPIDDSWKYMTIKSMSVLGVDMQKNIDYLYKNIYRYEGDKDD